MASDPVRQQPSSAPSAQAVDATTTYQYLPLDASRQEIRLLELYPGEHKDRLIGRLRTVSLLDEAIAEYETISYVWGSSVKPDTIELSGEGLAIPRNTRAALQQVRLRYRSRILWIDSVCIDQGNLSERSQQVRYMASIYSKGLMNLIHLGNDDRMGGRVVEFLQRTESIVRKRTNNYERFATDIYYPNLQPLWESYRGFDLQAFEYLVLRPWFRLWVLQEAKLSSVNLCHLGRHTVPLMKVLRLITWLNKQGVTLQKFLVHRRTEVSIAKNLLGIGSMLRIVDDKYGKYQCNGFSHVPYGQLLVIGRYRQRSEPKDGVFAISALASRSTDLPRVDYTTSLKEILQNASRQVFAESSVELLEYIAHRPVDLEATNSIPSWVFRADLLYDFGYEPLALPTSLANYPATEAPSCIEGQIKDPDVLQIEGIAISSISHTGPILDHNTHRYDEQRLQWISKNLSLLGQRRHSGLSNTDLALLAVTIICNTDTSYRKASRAVLAKAEQLISLIFENIDHVQRLVTEESGDRIEVIASLRGPSRLLTDCCINRRIFSTDCEATSIGLGPLAAQPGDILAIVRDLRVPCVLRPRGGYFQFVGTAYVHGITNVGKSWYDEHKEVVFNIR